MSVLTNIFRVIRLLFAVSLIYIAANAVLQRFAVQTENETLRLQLKMLAQKTQKMTDSQAHLSKSIKELEESSSHMVDETLRERDIFKYFKINSSDELLAMDIPEPQGLVDDNTSTTEIFEDALFRVDQVDYNLKVLGKQLQGVRLLLAARADILSALPDGAPTPEGWVSSGFGMRKSPINGRTVMHRGIDIAARKGTPVLATADGVVHIAGWKGSYGKLITINHGYGIMTRYAHNSKLKVKAGEVVKKGQVIAEVGATGRTTGDHLHYEVYINDQPVNPRLFRESKTEETLAKNTAAQPATAATAGLEPSEQGPMGGEEDLSFENMSIAQLELASENSTEVEMPASAAVIAKAVSSKAGFWKELLQTVWNPFSLVVLASILFGVMLFVTVRHFSLLTGGVGQLMFALFDKFVASDDDGVQDSAM